MQDTNSEDQRQEAASYTEHTSQGWMSRLGDAAKGILFGGVLSVLAVPLLFWNEGRAVREHRALAEGAGAVVNASADKLDPALNGKLIHLSGKVSSPSPRTDPATGVAVSALSLVRTVEMYAWREETSSETKKNLGGGTETVTTTKYVKAWSATPSDSKNFKQRSYDNPAMPLKTETWHAADAKLGVHALSSAQVARLGGATDFALSGLPAGLTSGPAAGLPDNLRAKAQFHEGGVFVGRSPVSPDIGDLRIRYKQVGSTDASIVAVQAPTGLVAYKAKNGNTVEIVRNGLVPAKDLFQQAQSGNNMLTWILRIAGFVVMWIGLGLLFKPLAVLADVVPMLGSLVGFGTGLLAFLIALFGSFTTAAVAWIAYRPLVGLLLLGSACAVGVFVWMRRRPAQGRPAFA
jgi:hypothetical protein